MFSQRAVVRNERHIQPEFKSKRARIAKAASGNQSDTHTALTSFGNRLAVALRQLAARIEQRAVKIQSK
jgi:hypothetical protein